MELYQVYNVQKLVVEPMGNLHMVNCPIGKLPNKSPHWALDRMGNLQGSHVRPGHVRPGQANIGQARPG